MIRSMAYHTSMTIRARIVIAALLVAVAAFGAEKNSLPPWFPAQLFNPERVVAEDYDEASFFVAHPTKDNRDNYATEKYRGRYWSAHLMPKNPEQWRQNDQGLVLWKQAEKQLAAAGFRQVYRHESDNIVDATYEKPDPHRPTFVSVVLSSRDTSRNELTIVEVGPNPLVINMKPPAAVPEKFTDKDDFPYLPPPIPLKLERTEHADEPMLYSVPHEPYIVAGSGYTLKQYPNVPKISPLEAHDAYLEAFKKAGWTIGAEYPNEGVYAHYDKNGRDIYARMRHSEGRSFDLFVADTGSELKAALAKKCKAAVYGINFDFDKATLRPDSEPTLKQVLDVLKGDPKLSVEIGGHTDNVGKPDYNMKLSDRRAASVREWLVAHGIAANRLTSHGYGDTQPLVPNSSDENRAQNRRVELKKPGCK